MKSYKIVKIIVKFESIGCPCSISHFPFDNQFAVINNFSSFLSRDADARGYPLKAKSKVCPTCRGIGRVSFEDPRLWEYGNISMEGVSL